MITKSIHTLEAMAVLSDCYLCKITLIFSWRTQSAGGGVRTGIVTPHGRYSKSDHLLQDGEG